MEPPAAADGAQLTLHYEQALRALLSAQELPTTSPQVCDVAIQIVDSLPPRQGNELVAILTAAREAQQRRR